MKSIRLSILVYFLVLLAVALGAVSVLAYQTGLGFLEAKEAVRKQMLEEKFEEAQRTERDSFDRFLRNQARQLATQAWSQLWGHKVHHLMVLPLGGLSVAFQTQSALAVPIWVVAHPRGPSAQYLIRTVLAEIHFDEDALARDSEKHANNYYFQVNAPDVRTWRSRSLGDFSFDFNPGELARMRFGECKYDDVEMRSDVLVRRVQFKVAVALFPFPGLPARRGGMADRAASRRTESLARQELPSPALMIHFAADTGERDAAIAVKRAEVAAELASLRAESVATLATLRNRLLLIGLATFLATMAGGFWLVRFGLSPLRKLSEAVGKVSVKDFRLPLDDKRLPGELRPIVERLTQTLNLLKRAFAREKQAAADISHELRTPLAALLTTIEVGLRKQRPPEEYREILSDCHAAGKQMSQLVERLLALARLDAGVDTLRPRTIDVANLAEECASLVRPLAEARGLSLHVERNGGAQLNTDPDKLREVITNLLHNAIEYNRTNGQVDLKVEQDRDQLLVEVRDTGVGIAPAAREHIFERFYRADSSRHSDGLHAGLGLAIVKGYVDLMNGRIDVQSVEGQGSVFRLQLPTRPPTSPG
jgi:heavy metal sensor kinase